MKKICPPSLISLGDVRIQGGNDPAETLGRPGYSERGAITCGATELRAFDAALCASVEIIDPGLRLEASIRYSDLSRMNRRRSRD